MTQHFTNLLYHKYNTPLFTIEAACCKMPENIAGVWRNNLEKMLNFLQLIKTGVKGFVKNIDGQPLRNATLKVVGNALQYNVTKNLGHFRIILPAGPLQLEFSVEGYDSRIIPILLNPDTIFDMGDVILSKMNAVNAKLANNPSTVLVPGAVVPIQPNENPNTGSISGFVLDTSNHPIKGAKVVVENVRGAVIKEATATDKMGEFLIVTVPIGDHILSVTADGMVATKSSVVHVSAFSTSKGNVFHLESDEHVFGVPRLLFILVVGCLLLACVGCVVFGIMSYQNKKKEFNNYSFSLLSQDKERPLFEDDDDEEDTDLYRAPIKSKLRRKS